MWPCSQLVILHPADLHCVGELDQLDNDFIVCPLDLISGLAEGMGASIESLVGQSQLIPSLLMCCQHHDPAVRQSAFALVGDLTKTSLPHLRYAVLRGTLG